MRTVSSSLLFCLVKRGINVVKLIELFATPENLILFSPKLPWNKVYLFIDIFMSFCSCSPLWNTTKFFNRENETDAHADMLWRTIPRVVRLGVFQRKTELLHRKHYLPKFVWAKDTVWGEGPCFVALLGRELFVLVSIGYLVVTSERISAFNLTPFFLFVECARIWASSKWRFYARQFQLVAFESRKRRWILYTAFDDWKWAKTL